MSDDTSDDDNVIQFPLSSLLDKRFVLGCPTCVETRWHILLPQSEIRFSPDLSDDLSDEGITFHATPAPEVLECSGCGFRIELEDPVTH